MLNPGAIQAEEKKDSLVYIAFRQADKKDILGAVSTVNVTDLLEKSYSTYPLDGFQSLVGGYNGNIWGRRLLSW
ncbi:MAG: hypothetical protein LUD15_14115 [Bacteroides sp.]|nr:hypothetical protein [Bacteroides sp.]